MPIEDVDFMRTHSEKINYVFLVDSKDRDKAAWPTPAEYVVEFTTPFRNVIGLDVLDASVPRTMYNVDVTNNRFSFFICTTDYLALGTPPPAWTLATIDPGDYTIQTITVAINNVLVGKLWGAADPATTAKIVCEPISTPPDVKNILRFRSAYPFVLNMSDMSSMAETLGFDEYNSHNYSLTNYVIPPWNEDNRRLFGSVDHAESADASISTSVVFEGPRGVILSHPLINGVLAQKFVLSEAGFFTGVFVALRGKGVGAAFEVRRGIGDIPDMTSGGLVTGTGGTIALSAVDGTLSDGVPAQKIKLLENIEYWLIIKLLSDGSGQDIGVFYNDAIASATTLKYLSTGNIWTSYDLPGDSIYYKMSARIEVAQPYHVVTAPGIFNLVGERYIVLRCPEIEDNCYRSLSYSRHSLGLAKFKLGVVGYSENRMDFSSIPAREFHPVGKLSKLTLRFERSNGELYDFKGVNHTITFAVKYYEPVSRVPFERSVLNPNYNGDVVQYLIDQDIEDEDSDDQEYDYNRDRLANFRLQEKNYQPRAQAQDDLI